MINQISSIIIGVLMVLLTMLGAAYWYKGTEISELEQDLRTSRQQTIKVKSVTKAEGTTEKFEEMKPKQKKEVIKHEEVNLSIGEHSLFIK